MLSLLHGFTLQNYTVVWLINCLRLYCNIFIAFIILYGKIHKLHFSYWWSIRKTAYSWHDRIKISRITYVLTNANGINLGIGIYTCYHTNGFHTTTLSSPTNNSPGHPFTNMLWSQHGKVITPIIKCGWNYLSIHTLNGVTVEVCERITNFTPHFTGHVITYLCWD